MPPTLELLSVPGSFNHFSCCVSIAIKSTVSPFSWQKKDFATVQFLHSPFFIFKSPNFIMPSSSNFHPCPHGKAAKPTWNPYLWWWTPRLSAGDAWRQRLEVFVQDLALAEAGSAWIFTGVPAVDFWWGKNIIQLDLITVNHWINHHQRWLIEVGKITVSHLKVPEFLGFGLL